MNELKVTCPHCSQRIALDAEALAALRGHPVFECPSCGGVVPAPGAPAGLPATAGSVKVQVICQICEETVALEPGDFRLLQGNSHFECPGCGCPVPTPKIVYLPTAFPAEAQVPLETSRPPSEKGTGAALLLGGHRGTNRNLVILGVLTLLVLGGLGIYLATRKTGNTYNTTQRVTNEIIHNTYFQQLIASGVATKKDLEALVIIHAYGDGFIGVSRDELAWPQAAELALRVGGRVLEPGQGDAKAREALQAWLEENLAPQLAVPVWVQEGGQARILDGKETLAVTGIGRERRVLIHWLSTSDERVTDEIIHNPYFQQLIASGVTTEKDLEAVADIRPYGDGFIGISQERLSFEQAQVLAKRTGAQVLSIEANPAGSNQQLLEWLATSYGARAFPSVWVQERGEGRLFDGARILSVPTVDSPRKVFLHWKPVEGLDNGRIGQIAEVKLPGGKVMKFSYCPAGNFIMGSPEEEGGRSQSEKQMPVRITKGFWLAQTECTQEQWEALMGNNPSGFKGAALPVETVSWEEAQTYIGKLNQTAALPEGWKLALPTEAQWEYACRAGTKTVFSFGDSLTSLLASFNRGYPYGTTTNGAAPVGSYAANAWGLYDMHGNVSEWCSDWYAAELSGGVDPTGAKEGVYRVIRGGGWFSFAALCRAAFRSAFVPGFRSDGLGFRAALVPSK